MNYKLLFLIIILSIFTIQLSSFCPIILDLTILIDRSPSIERNHFKNALEAINNITERINTKNSVVFSVVQLSKTVNIRVQRLPMNNPDAKQRAFSNINQIVFDDNDQSGTDMGLAIRLIRNNIFDKIRDPLVPKVFILFTDGLFSPSNFDFQDQINEAKKSNVEIYSIATGSQIQYDNLIKLASSKNHVLEFDEYLELYTFINDRTVEKCDANGFNFIKNYD